MGVSRMLRFCVWNNDSLSLSSSCERAHMTKVCLSIGMSETRGPNTSGTDCTVR